MKAWLLDAPEGLSKLHLESVADPAPGADEVVIDLRYAALNPADRFLMENQYPARPAWPHVLGRDGSGTISAVGSDVRSFQIGQNVCVLRGPAGVERPGTFAEKVVVSADTVAPIPDGWSLEQAAAAPLVYLTAWRALTDWGDLPPGNVLVSGAGGGVGSAALQLGKALGHRIFALSRRPEKRRQLEAMGVALALDPSDPQWTRRLKDHLKDRRIDLAIDNVAGTLLPQMIATLGEHGKVSCVGRSGGEVPGFNTATLFFRQLRIGGIAVGAYTRSQAQAAWEKIVRHLGRTGERPLIDHIYPFDQLPAAFERLTHSPMGKVLVAVGE